MTVQIIDPLNPLPPTYENNQHALQLSDGDVALIVSGAEVAAHGWWANGIVAGINTSLTIDGRVYSEFASGILSSGSNITVGASGYIEGWNGAIWFRPYEGQVNVLNNAGQVVGPAEGFAAVVVEGGTNIINNSGLIGGGFGGIQTNAFTDPDELIIINNTGVIRGSEWSISGSWYGRHIITNTGLMDGMIILGYGNDVYDGRGGVATDEIWLDAGDDVAFGGSGAEMFALGEGTNFVDGGDGVDTLNFYKAATVDLRVTNKQNTGNESWDTIRNIESLNGSEFADRFIGNDTANTFVGNAGNDTLDGYDGNDLLSGGAGDDLLVGGSGTDTAVFSGKFSDYTITVIAGAGIKITDNRTSGDGTDYLGGMEFALFSDRIFTLPPIPPVGPVTSDTPPATPVENRTFKGGSRADVFVGGEGHDLLNGGRGNDRLTGGEGQDTFAFSSRLGSKNVDRIIDFTHADDTMKLSKSIFGNLKKGMLSKGAFWKGAKAHDKSDRIIYNEKTGALSYDADGTGKKYGAIKFAQLNKKTYLKADDFFIV